MSSAHKSPIVRAIVLKILSNLRDQNFKESPGRIDVDFVPSVKGADKGLKKSIMQRGAIPISRPITETPKPVSIRPAQKPIPKPRTYVAAPAAEGEYGKIQTLLNDRAISYIECPGKDKQVWIMRMGQKQITKIVLTEEEIGNLLKTFSEKAMIPLNEGVFKVAVDDLVVNAVVSEVVGNKFVIRRQPVGFRPGPVGRR